MTEFHLVLIVLSLCSWVFADTGSWNEYPYPPSITQEVPPPSPDAAYGPPGPVVYEAYDGNKLHYGPTDGGYGPPPNLIAHANHPSYFTGSHLAHVGYWIGAVWDKIITFLEPFAFLGLIANGIYVLRLMLPPFFFGTLTPHLVGRKGKSVSPEVDSNEWYFRQLISSISDNVCKQRVACKSGIATAPFLASSSQKVMRNLRKMSPKFGPYTELVSTYLDAASGLVTDCEQYICDRNQPQTTTIKSTSGATYSGEKETGLTVQTSKNEEALEPIKSELEQETTKLKLDSELQTGSNRLNLSESPRKFPRD